MKLISRKGESLEPSWSGKRGSNPRPSAWKADALPSELFPPLNPKRPSSSVPTIYLLVGRGGFEPPKAEPSDLQSDPFGHSGTSPENRRSSKNNHKSYQKNLAGTIDSPKPSHPTKPVWKNRRHSPPDFLRRGPGGASRRGAGERTRTSDLLITNQLLYQLSYASQQRRVKLGPPAHLVNPLYPPRENETQGARGRGFDLGYQRAHKGET